MKIEENGEIIDYSDQKRDKNVYLSTPIYIKNNIIEWFAYSSWDTDQYKNMEGYYNSPERIIEIVNIDTERK